MIFVGKARIYFDDKFVTEFEGDEITADVIIDVAKKIGLRRFEVFLEEGGKEIMKTQEDFPLKLNNDVKIVLRPIDICGY